LADGKRIDDIAATGREEVAAPHEEEGDDTARDHAIPGDRRPLCGRLGSSGRGSGGLAERGLLLGRQSATERTRDLRADWDF
jgi:hypothetical protein